MFDQLPRDAQAVQDWPAADFQPYFDALLARELNAEALDAWMRDVTHLLWLLEDVATHLEVQTTQNTADEAAEARYKRYLNELYPMVKVNETQLKRRLVESGLEPADYAVPLRNIRTEVALFREANVPLSQQLGNLSLEYNRVIGAQTVTWEGEEHTLPALRPLMMRPERDERQRLWRAIAERQLQDRDALNAIWVKMLDLRQQMAHNAGFDSYLAYQWQNFNRHDYTPDDARRFHEAIAAEAVPALRRIRQQQAAALGVDSLRPWDVMGWAALAYDPEGRPPLKPFAQVDELVNTTQTIFNRIDPELGAYFDDMRTQQRMDLDNRKNKAPGGYCTSFEMTQRPFIFMNAVGIHDDVMTLLHECGHAFHVFSMEHWPYILQNNFPIEFAEVASTAMELLALPYLKREMGGFYDEDDALRAQREQIEGLIGFWPYMAVVDAFQHWVYANVDAARDPAQCDAQWLSLWRRYMPGVDITGIEDWVSTIWQRQLHIFELPLYYIEYGLAQLGAVQIWARAQDDQAAALRDYRRALALGNTVSLPELFRAAGARLAFDAATLRDAIALLEKHLRA